MTLPGILKPLARSKILAPAPLLTQLQTGLAARSAFVFWSRAPPGFLSRDGEHCFAAGVSPANV